MVWLLQTRHTSRVRAPRRLRAPTPARDPAQAGEASRQRTMRGRPPTLAECVLRYAAAVHPSHSLCPGETLPMRKPTTGEPCAGKLHARFGGRGGLQPSLPLSTVGQSFRRLISRSADSGYKNPLPSREGVGGGGNTAAS